MAGYHVENFGCRASRADGEAIAAALRERGLTAVGEAQTADIVILNTCTVTGQADRTARAYVRRTVRANPNARILVTGCYAQRAPDEIAALPGVAAVIGNSHKGLVPDIAYRLAPGEAAAFRPRAGFVPLSALRRSALDRGAPSREPVMVPGGIPVLADDSFAHSDLAVLELGVPHLGVPGLGARGYTRPNLKVQDGCGNRCSFCIIPSTRGHSRSVPMEQCLPAVEHFVASGGSELVLSGINLGRWGRDLTPQRSLDDLVLAILSRTALPRLRLSSIEPMDWSPRLIALFAEYAREQEGATPAGPRIARHAHLPLQSGSDAILRAMHRRYRPWHYAEKLRALHTAAPHAALGADVMVGFPGETDALFEESYSFIAAQPLTYLHLFPFSARPGTPGWQLHRDTPVPPQATKERMARLRALAAEKNLAFRRGLLGRSLPAVTLRAAACSHEAAASHAAAAGEDPKQSSHSSTPALTDNFVEVEIAGKIPANRCIRVVIKHVAQNLSTAHLAV